MNAVSDKTDSDPTLVSSEVFGLHTDTNTAECWKRIVWQGLSNERHIEQVNMQGDDSMGGVSGSRERLILDLLHSIVLS